MILFRPVDICCTSTCYSPFWGRVHVRVLLWGGGGRFFFYSLNFFSLVCKHHLKFLFYFFFLIYLLLYRLPSGNDPKSSLPERRAPSAPKFWASSSPENFSWLFFGKNFENWKTNPILGGGLCCISLGPFFSRIWLYNWFDIFQLLLSRLSVILFVEIQFVVCSNYKQVAQSQ